MRLFTIQMIKFSCLFKSFRTCAHQIMFNMYTDIKFWLVECLFLLTERSAAPIQEVSTIIEEPSVLDESATTTRTKRRERQSLKSPKPVPTPSREPDLSLNNTTNPFSNTFTEAPIDLPGGPPSLLNPHLDPYETEPPSIAPFSVPPPSVPPQSVAPPSVLPHDAPVSVGLKYNTVFAVRFIFSNTFARIHLF